MNPHTKRIAPSDASEPMNASRVDALLRAEAPLAVGRSPHALRSRVLAEIARRESRTAGDAPLGWASLWFMSGGWALAAAVCLIAAGFWWTTIRPAGSAITPRPAAVVMLTEAIEQSSAQARSVKPEAPILSEARRLQGDLGRGVALVRSVLPKGIAQGS